MATVIHPTAIVDPAAQLDEGVEVGPFAIIEAGVTLGARTRVGARAHLQGLAEFGADNILFPGVTLGFPPQHLGYDGSPTRLIVGARNTFREYVNVHRSFKPETPTTIGDDNFFMGFVHIGHDTQIGNGNTIANGTVLGGHVTVGHRAFISGNCALHQFTRVGSLAMIAGLARVVQDVPPFTMIDETNRIIGLNSVGLRRAGYSAAERGELKLLLKAIYLGKDILSANLAALDASEYTEAGQELINFFKTGKRSIASLKIRKFSEGEE